MSRSNGRKPTRNGRTNGTSKELLTVSSFFSGIGGFDLGFERAGFRLTMHCEIDPFCNEILERHWLDVPRQTDIREVSHADIPLSTVWTGGFPCQDISVARMGARKGLRGSRSGLFNEFARLVERGRPPVLVIENVPGLLSSHGGRDFQFVVQTLADIGYGVGWRVLNSKDFGVPQSRRRVYVVGCYRDGQGPGQILFEPERGEGDAAPHRSNGSKPVSPFKKVLGDPRKGPIVQGIAYCLYACSARHTGTDWSRTYVSYPDGRVRRLTPRECEVIQGFPTDWSVPAKPPSDPERLDTLRYQAIGNAVSVPVAEWLGHRVRRYIEAQAFSSMSPRGAVRVPASVGGT